MSLGVALVVLLAAPAVEPTHYVMSVGGVPVGALSFTVSGSQYTYQSHTLYRGGRSEITTQRFDLATSRPEVWWLSMKRPDGCVIALEERERSEETVCTEAAGTKGTIDGQPFTATYDARGRLITLELAGARFDASAPGLPRAQPKGAPKADPFAAGFAVHGTGRGRFSLTPRAELDTPARVRGALSPDAKADDGCLQLARAFIAKNAGARVVTGLVIDENRAWPHAWVKTADGEHVDPTVDAEEPNERPYLAFTGAESGRLFLELLSGSRKVMRLPASARPPER